MKIVIANSLYAPHMIGGAEISTQILAEAFASGKKFEIHILTVGSQSRREGIRRDYVNGVIVHRIPHCNLYWVGDTRKRHTIQKVIRRLIDFYNPLQRRLIKQRLQQINPELVHTQNLSGLGTAIWKIAAAMRIPVVHTLRDYSLISPVSSPVKNKLLTSLYTFMTKINSRCVSAVTGISSYILARHLEDGLFPASIAKVIPNAVDGKIAAERYLQRSKGLVLGYFGRMEPEKGVQYLLEAIKQLPKEMITKVYLCGEGSLWQSFTEQYKGDSRLVFTGKVPPSEARRLMGLVDVNVIPSTWAEPFGRVIIESYQAGVPVYGANVGGIPDVIMDEAFLFQPADAAAIADKIKQYHALTDEQRQLIHSLCLEHCRGFTTRALLERHESLYQSVMGQRQQIHHLEQVESSLHI